MDEYDSLDKEELEEKGFTVFDCDLPEPNEDYEDEYEFLDDEEFDICPMAEAMGEDRKRKELRENS